MLADVLERRMRRKHPRHGRDADARKSGRNLGIGIEVQRRRSRVAHDPVDCQAVDVLESADGPLRPWSEVAVNPTGVEPQFFEAEL